MSNYSPGEPREIWVWPLLPHQIHPMKALKTQNKQVVSVLFEERGTGKENKSNLIPTGMSLPANLVFVVSSLHAWITLKIYSKHERNDWRKTISDHADPVCINSKIWSVHFLVKILIPNKFYKYSDTWDIVLKRTLERCMDRWIQWQPMAKITASQQRALSSWTWRCK